MNTLSKAFVVINLLLGVVFLAVSAVLFSVQDNWKAEYKALAEDVESTTQEWNSTFESQKKIINELDQQVATLKGNVETLTAERNAAREQLAKVKEIQAGLEAKLADLNNQIMESNTISKRAQTDSDEYKKQKETLSKELATVRQRLDETIDERAKLKAEAKDLELKIASFEQQVKEQSGKINRLDSIVASYQAAYPNYEPKVEGEVAPPIQAIVEAVDSEAGIVMLSVGEEDQVKKGFTFYVYRGTSYIGEVEVDKVLPTKAAAKINSKMTRASIQPGDGAKTRLGSY